nr:hypothetical protein [Stackebrandtia albiflava]
MVRRASRSSAGSIPVTSASKVSSRPASPAHDHAPSVNRQLSSV